MKDSHSHPSASSAEPHVATNTATREGNGALWYAVFAPPAAWTVALLLSIALHHDFCAAVYSHTLRPWTAIGLLLTAIAVISLILSLSAGLTAWRAHSRVGSDDGLGNTDLDRRRFMARAGLLSAALFSYGIVLIGISPFLVPVTWCS